MLKGVFVEIFSELKDPRVERTQKHVFLDVIGLALFATLAGAQCFTEIEQFCKLHQSWLNNYSQLPNGIPTHDTFLRIFSAINHSEFQRCFFDWTKMVIELFPENVIAIDGKSIRASRRDREGLRALHVVSAFSCANGISLGHRISAHNVFDHPRATYTSFSSIYNCIVLPFLNSLAFSNPLCSVTNLLISISSS